jgi:3-hydroxybutyryl-CoA dehydrogenase
MKSLQDIKTIAIVGSGTMGSGIGQLAAMAGYKTIMYDLNVNALEKAKARIEKNMGGAIKRGKMSEEDKKAAMSLIEFTTEFDNLKADLILEAILEKLDLKQDLFTNLAAQNDDDTILATNTSSIPITRIARHIPNPGRVVGMHFFNPAHIMKLVEVISGAATDDAVAKTVFELAEKMGKVAVMAKDSPGFIVNRVARHFYVESLKTLEENVADHETIDNLMQNIGFKMGPFQLMDLIGVETNLSVTTAMYEAFNYDSKFRPSRIQQQKADAGHHGRKSGRGFYRYEE